MEKVKTICEVSFRYNWQTDGIKFRKTTQSNIRLNKIKTIQVYYNHLIFTPMPRMRLDKQTV